MGHKHDYILGLPETAAIADESRATINSFPSNNSILSIWIKTN